ncbi:MAG: nucleotidyltransferase domain-containing protein, partial [Anaerolineae bacterium]|nr:nucleotidyltransferase domain-containing protein [Anaerolineae bacterium]
MISQSKLGVSEVIGEKREAVLRLAEYYGARNVRVFGSVARGDATHDSDVDFLVDFPPGYRLLDHTGLQQELQTLLGRRVEVAIE